MVGSSPALCFVKTEHKLTLKKSIVCLFLKLGEEVRPAFTLTYKAAQLLKEQLGDSSVSFWSLWNLMGVAGAGLTVKTQDGGMKT